jgi:hypothetical protein
MRISTGAVLVLMLAFAGGLAAGEGPFHGT